MYGIQPKHAATSTYAITLLSKLTLLMSFVKSIIIIIIIIFDYMSKHKDPNQRPNEIRPMYSCCRAFLYEKKNNNNKKNKEKG